MSRSRFIIGIICCVGSAVLIALDRATAPLAGGIALLTLGITLIATSRRGTG